MNDRLSFNLSLPAHAMSVSVARAVIRSICNTIAPHLADSAELVVSELVTNSVRHGSTGPAQHVDVELVVDDGGLRGSVSDEGPSFEHPPPLPSEGSVGGFGLHIAGSLSEMTVRRSGQRNVVSFTMPVVV